MFGGRVEDAPERIVKMGRRVSLSFEPEEGRMMGGPNTTEGFIVEIENVGLCSSLNSQTLLSAAVLLAP